MLRTGLWTKHGNILQVEWLLKVYVLDNGAYWRGRGRSREGGFFKQKCLSYASMCEQSVYGLGVKTYLMTHLDRTPPGLWWHTYTQTVRYIFSVTCCLYRQMLDVSCMNMSFCAAFNDIMKHLLTHVTPLPTHTHTDTHTSAGISQMFGSWLNNQKWVCVTELHFALGQVQHVITDEGEITNMYIKLHDVRGSTALQFQLLLNILASENVRLRNELNVLLCTIWMSRW